MGFIPKQHFLSLNPLVPELPETVQSFTHCATIVSVTRHRVHTVLHVVIKSLMGESAYEVVGKNDGNDEGRVVCILHIGPSVEPRNQT